MRRTVSAFLFAAGLAMVGVGCRRSAPPEVEAVPPSGAPATALRQAPGTSDAAIWRVVYGMVVLAEEREGENLGTPKLLWGGDDHDESFVAAVDSALGPPAVRSVRGEVVITGRDGTTCSTSLANEPRLIAWAYPPVGAGWWERLEPEDPSLAAEVLSSGRRYWIQDAGACEGFGWATRPGIASSYSPGVSVEPASADLRPAARWKQWQQEFLAFRAAVGAAAELPATWDALAGWQKSWRLESSGLNLTATCFARFHEEEAAAGSARFERNGLIVRDAAGDVVPADWVASMPDESCGDLGVLRVGRARPIVTLSTNRGYWAFAFDGSGLVALPQLSVSGR